MPLVSLQYSASKFEASMPCFLAAAAMRRATFFFSPAGRSVCLNRDIASRICPSSWVGSFQVEVSSAAAEAAVDDLQTLLPGRLIDDLGSNAYLFQVVLKANVDQLADSGRLVHLADVAETLAVSSFGNLVRPRFEIGGGACVIEDLAILVHDFRCGHAPDFAFGFINLGDLAKQIQCLHVYSKAKGPLSVAALVVSFAAFIPSRPPAMESSHACKR